MSKITPVRLDDDTIKQLDMLVSLGIFSSRNEAIRELIKLGISNIDEIKEIMNIVKQLEELDDKMPIELKVATKLLIKKRDRF
ncbi:MAG: hypothetical protein KatS3mg003_2030 [Candidatus Nitrosocaldaceae archaeon]|nr:MAG: hypothetical protein KatS3mg003_2025 [Candidatus Nitrosocaldaceae archaeon]GIU72551.1 MAG: hypothetical protein KatS3mg003_2030 [Candidatus Nitrosocaldaceae archaeon]